ncbi:S-layer homology domain-containing protein [Candidatus Gracilibacteria bacterium]|nr:S-layer homology domain-containing protein [Candidatus Gracilibacteria bacterium]
MKNKIRTLFFLLSFLLGVSGQDAGAFARFRDDAEIPTWALESVDMLREAGIMTGFGDQTFRPGKVLNRAEALVVLFRTKGVDLEETQVRQNNFSDVPSDAWFAREVGEAVHLGWINGFPDGTFRPNKAVNKAEWATIVMRAFGIEDDQENPEFRDVPSSVWYTQAVYSLAANDLLRVRGMNFFPSQSVTRAEAAWMIAQIMGKPRLMGKSQTNDFESYAQKRDSRRTAIRPRDFNPYQQGYDIEKQELKLNVVPKEESILVRRDSDWVDMGVIHAKNALEDKAQLHSLELKFIFAEPNVGPESNFLFHIEGGGFEKEQKVGPTGNIFIPGIDIYLDPQEEMEFSVSLKPSGDMSFYASEGGGELSLFRATGSMIGTFNRDNPARNGSYRSAPIGIEQREFTPLTFRP